MISIFAAHCSKKSYKMTLGPIEGHAVPYPTDEPWAGLEWPDWVVGSCEVSAGHRQCWQMGCMERWHRRHSLPPGKLASSPPSGPKTHCIRQQGLRVRFTKTEFKTEAAVLSSEVKAEVKGCQSIFFGVQLIYYWVLTFCIGLISLHMQSFSSVSARLLWS